MAEASILMKSALRVPIEFDPANEEHREAYRMLIEDGRQHPSLRFVVDPPFVDAVAVMEKRLAIHAVKALSTKTKHKADNKNVVSPFKAINIGG